MGMHTHYHKGTPLYIRLKSGEVIFGRFEDHKSGCVILDNGRRINLSEVKAMSIRKLKPKTSSYRREWIRLRTILTIVSFPWILHGQAMTKNFKGFLSSLFALTNLLLLIEFVKIKMR